MFDLPGLGQIAPLPQQLDAPGQIGPLAPRNRVVVAAMTTGFASSAGRPTPRLVAWYGARAAGGAGTVIVEETYVLDEPSGLPAVPRHLRLTGEGALPSFRRLVRTIHEGGALAMLQIGPPRLGDPSTLRASEIGRAVAACAATAQLAQRAGFDGVQIQAIPSRLFGLLLSPLSNKRHDRYGRSSGGRLRALRESVEAVRRTTADALPVLVKLTADERHPKGINPDVAAEIVRSLAAAGVAGFEIVGGAGPGSVPASELLSCGVGEATRADLSAAIRTALQGTGAVTICSGRIVSADSAEKVLRSAEADLTALGRAALADPAWTAKVRAGLEDEIAPCIGCMACFTPAPDGGIGCPVNGDSGHEYLPPMARTENPRRIAVLGASLAGLELARIAASCGHEVSITTSGLPLGGLLGLRAGVPGNAEFGRAFLYVGDKLRELGVFIEEELEGDWDLTVDCRPGPELKPQWARGKGVLFAGGLLGRDLHEMYGIGRRVVVAGPGALVAEVALFLAGWGRRCTVVVPGKEDSPFPDVHPSHAARLLERLEGYKVPLVTGAIAREWRPDEDRKSQLIVERDGKLETLEPFHSVVSAEGWEKPSTWPQRSQLPRRVPNLAGVPTGYVLKVGDTLYPEPLRDAVLFANRLGRVL
jgi:2,4-dienoyl-CoA reductase-like NADH-dependent reductase (Old Yellow Enzyme family)